MCRLDAGRVVGCFGALKRLQNTIWLRFLLAKLRYCTCSTVEAVTIMMGGASTVGIAGRLPSKTWKVSGFQNGC